MIRALPWLALTASLALVAAMALSNRVADRVGGWVERITGRQSVSSQHDERVRSLEQAYLESEARAVADLKLADNARWAAVVAQSKAEDAARTARQEADEARQALARAARPVPFRGFAATPAEAVADTADRFAALTLQTGSEAVASSYAEALPVIGVGVIAANTGAQLDAACRAMAALNELNMALNPDRPVSPDARAVCALEAPDRDALWAASTTDPATVWADARALHPSLPALDIGPQWLSARGMWQAVFDWAYGSASGPADAAGQGPSGPPATLSPTDPQANGAAP